MCDSPTPFIDAFTDAHHSSIRVVGDGSEKGDDRFFGRGGKRYVVKCDLERGGGRGKRGMGGGIERIDPGN